MSRLNLPALIALGLAIIALDAVVTVASAAEVQIDCIPPTQNTDGTPVSLKELRLYAQVPNGPPEKLDTKTAAQGCHFVRPSVSVGAHVYYVTAVNVQGAESDLSEPYTQDVPPPPPPKPNPPTGLTGKVTKP